jgi:predicted dinucleotide-binding enzyme
VFNEIGFTAVDAGTLAETRRQQPGSPLYLAYAESRRQGAPITAPRLRELLAEA